MEMNLIEIILVLMILPMGWIVVKNQRVLRDWMAQRQLNRRHRRIAKLQAEIMADLNKGLQNK